MMGKSWDEVEYWWGTVWKKTVGPYYTEVILDWTDTFHWKIRELGDTIDAGSERHLLLAMAEVDRRILKNATGASYAG